MTKVEVLKKILLGGFKDFLNVHPYLGFHDPIWRTRIFFRWVGEKPPTRIRLWANQCKSMQIITSTLTSHKSHLIGTSESRDENLEVSMCLHGLMVMAKNVADHRLVAEGRSFLRERNSTEIWCFSCFLWWGFKEIWTEAKQKWWKRCEIDSCGTKPTFCLMWSWEGHELFGWIVVLVPRKYHANWNHQCVV